MQCLTNEKKLGLRGGLEGKKVQGGERVDASDHAALSGGSETNNEKKKGGWIFFFFLKG